MNLVRCESSNDRARGLFGYRQLRRRPIAHRHASPTDQRQLLLNRMQCRARPNLLWRRRNVIVQSRVLIMSVSHAVWGAASARQEARSRSAVQVVNNVITGAMKVARDARPRRIAVTRNRHNAID